MKEGQILAAACAHVDCTLEQVLGHHIYEDYITLVVDRGIAGGPKYTVMLADLELPEAKGDTIMRGVPAIAQAGEVDITANALRLAEEHGIKLASVAGTGKAGRILKKDVEALL